MWSPPRIWGPMMRRRWLEGDCGLAFYSIFPLYTTIPGFSFVIVTISIPGRHLESSPRLGIPHYGLASQGMDAKLYPLENTGAGWGGFGGITSGRGTQNLAGLGASMTPRTTKGGSSLDSGHHQHWAGAFFVNIFISWHHHPFFLFSFFLFDGKGITRLSVLDKER